MKRERELISTSKFLSLVLRHQPEVIDVQLDPEGWVDVETLIRQANALGKPMTLELLHDVVATSDKQRFALSEDGLRIRANQGHSLPGIDLRLEAKTPPPTLFHGTVANFLESIRRQGLQKRSRHHVHLSADLETARKVGQRRGKAILLEIDSQRMHDAGYQFLVSANGVWLVDEVPVAYLRFPE